MNNPDNELLKLAEQAQEWQPETEAPKVKTENNLDAFDEKGRVVPLNAARMISIKHPHLVHVSGDFYDFTGRIYECLPVQRIDAETIGLIGRASRRNILFDVRHLAAVECYHDDDFFDQSSGFIVLENGVLKVATRELLPFSPDIHARNMMPVLYDANADCPRFRQCLEEWLPDDPGARGVLVEWLGYCLVLDMSQHKMLVLLGEGGNGKSVYIAVVEMLQGAANIAGMPLAALRADRTFPTAGLQGKLVNICPESELSGDIDEGWIKSLISGDSIEVERKGRDPFTMQPTARFILQSNNPPRIKDRSDGIWRRIMPVRFSRTFTESEQDRELPEKLRAELPGILNLALEGLHRLATRGRFEFTPMMQAELQSYRDECNPLAAWKDERLITVEPDLSGVVSWLPIADAYMDYRDWTKDMGHQAASRSKFTRDLKRLGVEDITRKDQAGRTTRAFSGVALS